MDLKFFFWEIHRFHQNSKGKVRSATHTQKLRIPAFEDHISAVSRGKKNYLIDSQEAGKVDKPGDDKYLLLSLLLDHRF